MTNDSDFFVFDVPGVIHLGWMIKDIDRSRTSHSIDVYPHDRMMERLNLNCSSIRYLAFLCGNDFVDSVGFCCSFYIRWALMWTLMCKSAKVLVIPTKPL